MTLRLLFLLLFSVSVSAQSSFQKIITNSTLAFEFSSASAINNGFLIAGLHTTEPVLIKLDTLFQPIWSYNISGSISFNYYLHCREDSKNQYRFIEVNRSGSGQRCFSTLITDSIGSLIQKTDFNLSSACSIYDPVLTSLNDNGSIIAINSSGIQHSPYIILMRTDTNDLVQWSKAIKMSGGVSCQNLLSINDSTFYLCTSGYIGKYDLNGNELSSFYFYGLEKAFSLSDGFIIYGSQLSKIDTNGTVLWSYKLDSIKLNDIEIRQNGNILGIGWLYSSGGLNVVVAEFDSTGNFLNGTKNTINMGFGMTRLIKKDSDLYAFFNLAAANIHSVINKPDSLLSTGCPSEVPFNLIQTPTNLVSPITGIYDSVFAVQQTISSGTNFPYSISVLDQCSTVGVEDLNASKQPKIFPNPTSGSISITLPGFVKTNPTLQIFSLDGKIFFSQEVHFTSESTSLTIDIPAGYYILKILSESDVFTSKICINR